MRYPYRAHAHALDLLCIGESLRDVFYLLDGASVTCSLHRERCLLCLEYAEKIPVKHIVKSTRPGIPRTRPSAPAPARPARGSSPGSAKTPPAQTSSRPCASQIDTQGIHIDPPSHERGDTPSSKNATQPCTSDRVNTSSRRSLATKAVYYSRDGLERCADVDRRLLAHLKSIPTRLAFQPRHDAYPR